MTGPWPLLTSLLALVGAGAVILYTGFRITRVVDELADRTGIGEAVAGAALLGAVTSVSGLVQIAVADVAYRPGPIYADAGPAGLLLAGGCLLITAVVAAGLVLRQERGMGFEGFAVPVLWAGTIAGVAFV